MQPAFLASIQCQISALRSEHKLLLGLLSVGCKEIHSLSQVRLLALWLLVILGGMMVP